MMVACCAVPSMGILNRVSDVQVYANGVRHSRRDSPDYLTLNNQIEEAR